VGGFAVARLTQALGGAGCGWSEGGRSEVVVLVRSEVWVTAVRGRKSWLVRVRPKWGGCVGERQGVGYGRAFCKMLCGQRPCVLVTVGNGYGRWDDNTSCNPAVPSCIMLLHLVSYSREQRRQDPPADAEQSP
jgi:hypothetical protein